MTMDERVEQFEQALTEVATQGEEGKASALARLERIAAGLPGDRQAAAREILAAMRQAPDFVTLWQQLHRFVPLLQEAGAQAPTGAVRSGSATFAAAPPRSQEPAAPPSGEAAEHVAKGPDGTQPSTGAATEPFHWKAPALPAEMLADFFAEVGEHLDEVAALVLSVQGPEDEAMYELYRKLHTVKGNSGMVGLTALQEVAHRLEDLVKSMREAGRAPDDAVRQVLADGAELSRTILDLAQSGREGRLPIKDFVARVDSLLAGGGSAASAAAAPRSQASEDAVRSDSVTFAAAPPRSQGAEGTQGEHLASHGTGPAEPSPRSRPDGSQDPDGAYRSTGAVMEPATGRRMLRVDFGQVDHLAMLVGEQAVKQEEVSKQIERMEEGVEELYRQLDLGAQADPTTRERLLTKVRSTSKDLGTLAAGLDGSSKALDLVSSDIQRAILDLRMVPLEALFARHKMTVFQAASALGKKARLVIEAGDAKLDKSLAEKLEEPLIHLIRNAVSHGLSRPEERVRQGKPAEGRVTVRAYHQGSQVVVQVEDDGVGISAENIRRKAVEKGFLTEEESRKTDDHRIVDLIFAPGFSTTARADDVSGRGVGLDVVRDKVNRMSGAIEIFSEPGKGTVFQLTLPLTLALAKVLLVQAGGETTALPADSIQRVETIATDAIATVDGKHVVRLGEETLPFIHLGRMLGLTRIQEFREETVAAIAVFGNLRAALAVDRILMPTQAVVREGGAVLPRIPYCMGVTFHEGRCVLIVDVGAVLRDWAENPLSKDPWNIRQSAVVVTTEPGRYQALAVPSRRGDVKLALASPGRLPRMPLRQAGVLLLDAGVPALEGVAEMVAGMAPEVPRILLVPEERSLRDLRLDVLYRHGVEDVWRLGGDAVRLVELLARRREGQR
jgi:two-component system chemotaxis sensor kinase CheA